MRLLAPWSSWEDAQIQGTQIGPAQTGPVTPRIPRESAEPTQAPRAVLPRQPEPPQATQAATEVPPAQPGPAPSTSVAPNHPAAPTIIDVPGREPLAPSVTVTPVADAGADASKARLPRPGSDGDEARGDFAESALPRFLKSVSSGDFGGED